MTSLASISERVAGRHPDDTATFGQAAVRIRDGECLKHGLRLADMRSRGQGRALVDARNDIAFRVWTEVPSSSTTMIARLIGRRDHSAAIHAILAGARARGIEVSRVSDLRGRADPVDWTKLAYAAAGWREREDLTLERAGDRAGVGRGEWRHAERGRSLSAGTLLAVCRTIGLDPMTLLTASRAAPPADAGWPSGGASETSDGRQSAARPAAGVSRETPVKHGGAS